MARSKRGLIAESQSTISGFVTSLNLRSKDWEPEVGDVVQFRKPKKGERALDGTILERNIGTSKAYGIYAVVDAVNQSHDISLSYFTKKDQLTVLCSAWFKKECFNFICHYNDIFNIVTHQYKQPDEEEFK